MNSKSMHWVNRLAALGLIVGLVAGLAAAGSAQSVGGQAHSTSSAASVNILNGLITADEVVANVMSSASQGGAFSDAAGSTFTNLAIAGVGSLSGDSPVAPNTNISLPGVGYVVLNEQIPSGDGVTSSGLTVNMIHVYLQSLTGGGCTILGCLPGTLTNTGEIIVGSATSSVGP